MITTTTMSTKMMVVVVAMVVVGGGGGGGVAAVVVVVVKIGSQRCIYAFEAKKSIHQTIMLTTCSNDDGDNVWQ